MSLSKSATIRPIEVSLLPLFFFKCSTLRLTNKSRHDFDTERQFRGAISAATSRGINFACFFVVSSLYFSAALEWGDEETKQMRFVDGMRIASNWWVKPIEQIDLKMKIGIQYDTHYLAKKRNIIRPLLSRHIFFKVFLTKLDLKTDFNLIYFRI